MNPDTARAKIQRLEERIGQQLGTEVSVYGSGSQGYEKLSSFLRDGDKSVVNRSVRKQLHEYWVFLLVLQLCVDKYHEEWDIKYKAAKGGDRQLPVVDSIFVEPKLPIYPADRFWNDYGTDSRLLREPGTDDTPQHHTTPDFLIAESNVDKLPWGAQMGAEVEDVSKLMSWCSRGEYDKVREILELPDDLEMSAAEWFSKIQTLGTKENPEEAYQQWTEFSDRAEYLIECKHRSPTENDFSQVLWYALTYETPIALVTAERFGQHRRTFENEIDRLPVDVRLVEGVDFESVSDAREKLAFLQ